MTAVELTLVTMVIALSATVVTALGWGVRYVRRLDTRLASPRGRSDAVATAPSATRSATASADAAAQAQAQAQAEAEELLARAHRQAEREAEQLREAARRSAEREVAALTTEAQERLTGLKERAAELERRSTRLDERERRHADEATRLAEREKRLATAEAELARHTSALADEQAVLAAAHQTVHAELERIAGLTADAARAELVAGIEEQAKREAAVLVRDLEAEARRTGEARARHLVAEAIQRVASDQTTESTVSVLHLPSDDMKGRIIGREGRNIRAFESVTGVNLIVDDTPEAVLLSCFDPVRREVARVTMERLVADGRIHPHRIEEVAAAAQQDVAELCQRAAEEALLEVGITDLHPELVTLLGRLRYRTSYGQNVLRHLVETAHIAGLLASELRLEPAQARAAKRAAFLHDIGKALTHEVEGSHAKVGADVARRYGESDEVVHAIEAHHNEITPQTVEAVLTQAADACSGARPGARREGLSAYISRLERIEEIAVGKPGVEKVYAMQAGREVRVMVHPEQVDDIGAAVLARDVAKQIEEELTYPGQVRVTVVRELRATETAR
ncbi:ribonuclease Y [Natronosporangium hydrolyticum]|uniref:Ribonuclease Y n=1 Tax=Natronosporangium hydrolyticum TaxID=2811111 RepID=A0A895YDG8_9ACTN|nr:ribonuclease Y [Natronosporangium hydrolyticum]QSB13429.1 ribonuclease Y [Natronosporangium hydrolyticum]